MVADPEQVNDELHMYGRYPPSAAVCMYSSHEPVFCCFHNVIHVLVDFSTSSGVWSFWLVCVTDTLMLPFLSAQRLERLRKERQNQIKCKNIQWKERSSSQSGTAYYNCTCTCKCSCDWWTWCAPSFGRWGKWGRSFQQITVIYLFTSLIKYPTSNSSISWYFLVLRRKNCNCCVPENDLSV